MTKNHTPILLTPEPILEPVDVLEEENEDVPLLEPQADPEEEQTNPHDIHFWILKYAEHQQTGERYVKDITINYLKLLQVLKLLGFLRLDIDDAHLFVKVENSRVVKRVTSTNIIDAFWDFLDEKDYWIDENGTLNRDMLKEKFLKSLSSYFKEDKLYRLKPDKKIEFNKDTQNEKFFYYKNGFIKVSKAGIEFLDYAKLDKFIWETEILQRNFIQPATGGVSVFEKFLEKLCYSEGVDSSTRISSLKTIIGYLLHSFTDCEMIAVLLTDSKISDEGEANGRSGKTLLSKAIGYMLSSNPEDLSIKTFVDINGKDFDPKEKHKYQLVGYETKIICINDLKRYFDVDCVYNDVTEGVSVERKNLTPYKVKAKIILTSNKTVKIEGDSSKARFLEYEVSSYFHKNRTPKMEFGHWFFRDWNTDEWALFDWFMFSCSLEYFKNDCRMKEPEQINLNARKLRENTHPDFLDYMQDLKIEFDTWYNKKKLYEDFTNRYEDFRKDIKFKQAKFTGWLKTYTQFHGDFEPYNKERDEKRSDDLIEICFRKKAVQPGTKQEGKSDTFPFIG